MSKKLFIKSKDVASVLVIPSILSEKSFIERPDISTGNIFNIVLLRTKIIVSKIKLAIILFEKMFNITNTPKNKTENK